MPVKLSTTVSNIQTIPNEDNQKLVMEFYEFMKSSGTLDKYQNNNKRRRPVLDELWKNYAIKYVFIATVELFFTF